VRGEGANIPQTCTRRGNTAPREGATIVRAWLNRRSLSLGGFFAALGLAGPNEWRQDNGNRSNQESKFDFLAASEN